MRFLAVIFFLFLLLPYPAIHPEISSRIVKVALLEAQRATVECRAGFSVSGKQIPPGSYSLFAANGEIHDAGHDFGKDVSIVPQSPIDYLIVNGKSYRGNLEIKVKENNLRVINQLPLESYLYGVVGKEMPGSEIEALKAQAVASRTLAVNAFLKGKTLGSTVSQQVYDGVNGERIAGNEAVDDTRGDVLIYQGKVVELPLFFSTCGGRTESSQDVFGKAIPYLQSVPDSDSSELFSYCQAAPHFSWKVIWPVAELGKDLGSYGVHGSILDLVPKETDGNGRIKKLLVKTTEGEWLVHGFAIRKALKREDGKPLFSTWFTIRKNVQNGEISFEAEGKGEGHGVGLCQWGAIGMARSGKRYLDILSHYYSGTKVADFSAYL